MGHIQWLNQDGDWETFPSEEQEANFRANAELLAELQIQLVCQMCNAMPNALQIRQRYLKNEWTCEKCHTINSAGRA